MKKATLLTLTLGLILASCTPTDPPPNCGTVVFSWKANGTYYEGASNYHFLPSPGGLHSYGFTACTNGNAPSMSIRLREPIGTGTYQMIDVNDADFSNTGNASYLDGSGSSYYDTDSTYTGTFVIATFAPDSSISGTFSFNLLHSTSSNTINITEGTFSTIPWE